MGDGVAVTHALVLCEMGVYGVRDTGCETDFTELETWLVS